MKELASPATRSVTDPLAQWAVKNIRLDGRPFSFEGHAYLRAIYDDTSPHIVLSKAAQIGGTTWAILKSLHACRGGLNVGYFFPTKSDVLDFSKSRVSPLLTENPFLQKLVNDTDTAGLKRVGDGFLYLRGMQSTVGMKSVPVDLIVFDELDEAEPAAKAMAMERLSHSDYKRVIELSNPSLPDYGIDEQFQKSDQRHWTLRCSACNEWTAIDKAFPDKLGQEVRILIPRADGTVYRACPKCSSELDTEKGEWVADFPSRSIHGYRISQLFSSKVDPASILEEYRTTRYPDRFYNLKIGIPWSDLGRQLDMASVLSLCGDGILLDESPSRFRSAMGVDTGKQLHVVILREAPRDRYPQWDLIHLSKVQTFEDLDHLIKRYNIDHCVIDGMPETHPTRAFAKRNWSVSMCFFNEHQRGEPKWDKEALSVVVNRTEALDASRAAVRDKHLVLPRQTPLIEEFAKHLTADAKVLVEDEETGAKKYRYIKTGENHFSFAFTYAWLGASKHSGVIRSVDDIPCLPDTYRRGEEYGWSDGPTAYWARDRRDELW